MSSPPTGPREARPDDRLRRGSHKLARSPLALSSPGLTGRSSTHRSISDYWVPAFAGTTTECVAARSMRVNDVIMTRMDGASDCDHLDHALGQSAALCEIDADVLRASRLRRRCDQSGYSDRHRHKTDTAVGNAYHVFPGGRPSKLAISSSRLSKAALPGAGSSLCAAFCSTGDSNLGSSLGSRLSSNLGSMRGL